MGACEMFGNGVVMDRQGTGGVGVIGTGEMGVFADGQGTCFLRNVVTRNWHGNGRGRRSKGTVSMLNRRKCFTT